EHTQLAKLRPEIARKLVLAVDLVGTRRNLLVRKARHGLAQRVHVFAEREVKSPPRIRDHRRLSQWLFATIDGRRGFVRLTSARTTRSQSRETRRTRRYP